MAHLTPNAQVVVFLDPVPNHKFVPTSYPDPESARALFCLVTIIFALSLLRLHPRPDHLHLQFGVFAGKTWVGATKA